MRCREALGLGFSDDAIRPAVSVSCFSLRTVHFKAVVSIEH